MSSKKSEPHIRIPYSFLSRTDLKPLDKLLYSRLHNYAQKTGVAWPRQETLCTDLGIGEKAIQRSIRALKDAGLLEILPGSRSDGNRYRILPIDTTAIAIEDASLPAICPVQSADLSDTIGQNDAPLPPICPVEIAVLSYSLPPICPIESPEVAENKTLTKSVSENSRREVVKEVNKRSNLNEVIELSNAPAVFSASDGNITDEKSPETIALNAQTSIEDSHTTAENRQSRGDVPPPPGSAAPPPPAAQRANEKGKAVVIPEGLSLLELEKLWRDEEDSEVRKQYRRAYQARAGVEREAREAVEAAVEANARA